MVDDFEEGLIKEIDKIMDNVADDLFNNSQDNLLRKHIKDFKSGRSKEVITTDRGGLLKSGNVRRKLLDKTVIYTAPYGPDVEYGSVISTATADELRPWVKRKLLKGKGSKEQVERIARNIARALREKGQAPDPFLRPAMEKTLKRFK